MANDFLFTSESVSEGHPDKVADQISDAVLDAILTQDKRARVACETLVKTGAAIVAGESAVRSATATEEDRQVLAQALTVHAERQLLREQSEGVRDLLTRAAAVLAMTVPQPADDDGLDALDALRAIAAPLRERLGPARPRLREGR